MILVTGGCGYVGSHFVAKLIENNYEFLVIDDLSNSSRNTIEKLISHYQVDINLIEDDIRNEKTLKKIFELNNIDTIAHFAGLKSVSESEKFPEDYYSVNILGTEILLNTMDEYKISKFIFSSSATVYNKSHPLPWHEGLLNKIPENPYARTKFIVEEMLDKKVKKNTDLRVAILRYFNPIGSHKSGIIGENTYIKNGNLVPSILKVLSNKNEILNIYGNDFNTSDGSGVRDYIHINDLIDGHIKAMKYLDFNNGINIWNLGCGKGYSVYEVISKFEEIVGVKIPKKVISRRKGDLDKYWADVTKAKKDLDWEAKETLESMVIDVINFFNKEKDN